MISFLFAQNNLPQERKGDWFEAGYLRFLTKNFVISKLNNVLNYGATNDGNDQNNNNHTSIMEALDDQDSNEIIQVYFPAGTYKISSPIEIADKENIILRGAGSNLTKLIFNFNSKNNKVNIYIKNSQVIGIENLYIEREDSTDFGDNIKIRAQKCWISGVESNRAVSCHFHILASDSIEIRGCHLHHGWNYGVGGHGYGINLGSSSSKCLIENNIFNHFRHSVIMSNGPVSNVVGYNYSTDPYTTETYLGISDWPSDMCLHGHPDTSISGPERNLFEGNICAFMHADDAWYDNGPYNTYFRNRATYYGLKVYSESPNQNIIANEVDDSDGQLTDGLWNAYNIQSADNFVVGNTNFDPNPAQYPSSSDYSSDLSLYFNAASIPDFLNVLVYWPPIGVVDSIHQGGGTIPAKMRWDNGGIMTVAHPEHDVIVNILSVGNGTVTPEGIQTAGGNSLFTVTAKSDSGYCLSEWSVTEGITVENDDEIGVFKIAAPGVITAHFMVTTQHIVTVNSGGNGTVTPSGPQTVDHRQDLSISAVPATNYQFTEWSATGGLTIEDQASPDTKVLSIRDSGTVTAQFTPITHTVTVVQGANGTIAPAGTNGQIIVNQGTSMIFVITPDDNYKIVDVKVDNQSVGAVSTYSLISVMGNHTITASFDIATIITDSNESKGDLRGVFHAVPNPVNSKADYITFLYNGSKNTTAEMTIYDMVGNVVYTNTYIYLPGSESKQPVEFGKWNLRNRNGRIVAAGTYLVVLDVFGKLGVERYMINIGVQVD